MSDIDVIDLDEIVPLDSGDPLASAQAFLEVLKLVDGINSGLDADLLRGVTPDATGLALLPTATAAAARTVLELATTDTPAFAGLLAPYLRATTSGGLLLENNTGGDVALLGAGGSQGATFYGQINGTALVLGTDPGGSELLRVGGTTRIQSYLCVRDASAIGALAVRTATEATPASVASWDTTKHTVLAGPSDSSTASAFAASLNQTSGEVSLYALSPSVSWLAMALRCSSALVSCNGMDAAKFDDNATAGNTRFLIYDVDNGMLERVTVGAADSGGTGYKLLRIPN